MKTSESSGFRFYSLATCAANKQRKSMLIEAVPIEDMPMLDGDLTDNAEDYKAKGAGVDGENAFEHDLKTTASVEATWLPWNNSNRKTAPDVRRGERVMLFKYKDSDKFYWIELTDPDDETLRRLETVTYAWSNERNENKKIDHTNSYWMEVSTHDKYIHLETVKNDGEPYAYVVQINTKEGSVIIKDDDGNFILLDSKERNLRMENSDKSFVDLNKRIITIESLDEVNIKTKRYKLTAADSITEKTQTQSVTTTTFSHKSNGYSINTSTYGVTTNTFNFQSAQGMISGALDVGGNVKLGANLMVAGLSVHIGKSTGPGHV